MNAYISQEPARNGFATLPHAEKRWFLIRVRELSHRAAVHERPAMKGTALI
ncbi:MAG: hypothetical protein WCX63_06485 [Methanoregula sp.]